MELGSLFLFAALLVLSIFFVLRPVIDKEGLTKEPGRKFQADQELSALLAERDRLLSSLKELDFDNVLGKIPEAEFSQQRSILVQEGVKILKQIESLRPLRNGAVKNNGNQMGFSAEPEKPHTNSHTRLVNGKTQTAPAGIVVISNPEDELEMLIADRRRSRVSKADGFCPNCGAPHQISDLFCPKCGERIRMKSL